MKTITLAGVEHPVLPLTIGQVEELILGEQPTDAKGNIARSITIIAAAACDGLDEATIRTLRVTIQELNDAFGIIMEVCGLRKPAAGEAKAEA